MTSWGSIKEEDMGIGDTMLRFDSPAVTLSSGSAENCSSEKGLDGKKDPEGRIRGPYFDGSSGTVWLSHFRDRILGTKKVEMKRNRRYLPDYARIVARFWPEIVAGFSPEK